MMGHAVDHCSGVGSRYDSLMSCVSGELEVQGGAGRAEMAPCPTPRPVLSRLWDNSPQKPYPQGREESLRHEDEEDFQERGRKFRFR